MPDRCPSYVRPIASSLLLGTLLCLAACAVAPPAPGALTRWERERLMQVEHLLATAPTRIRDARLDLYLGQLLARLDAALAPPRHYVIARASPQADLVGGEVLRIHTGLLEAVRSEDELVFVLAHELAHRDLGHVAARRAAHWNAGRAELDADRAAAARLTALGYQAAAGRELLARLARSATDDAAPSLLRPRIDALPVAGDDATPGVVPAEFTRALAPYRSQGASR